jgi:hypothetical protein
MLSKVPYGVVRCIYTDWEVLPTQGVIRQEGDVLAVIQVKMRDEDVPYLILPIDGQLGDHLAGIEQNATVDEIGGR